MSNVHLYKDTFEAIHQGSSYHNSPRPEEEQDGVTEKGACSAMPEECTMNPMESLTGIGVLLAAMAILSVAEVLIPLRRRSRWSARHLGPNLALTLLTFVTSAGLNVGMLLGLVWLQSAGWGLFNAVELPLIVEIVLGIVVLDLAWYATHVSMHKSPFLWRFHSIHHSDPAVDVTTTIRQHPGETLVRYAYLAAFGFAVGASPVAFAIYRVWSALHGLFEHANIKLPQWLDTAITFVFSSPDMHKVHHSRDPRYTDTNYTNIFSIWDRLFGTFTPARHGRDVDYGLEGFDAPGHQSTIGLLALPLRASRRTTRPRAEATAEAGNPS
jgi:sterol desaturase/sphingolipid hydroxylase (fatty acid hydroxylase superfamily)